MLEEELYADFYDETFFFAGDAFLTLLNYTGEDLVDEDFKGSTMLRFHEEMMSDESSEEEPDDDDDDEYMFAEEAEDWVGFFWGG